MRTPDVNKWKINLKGKFEERLAASMPSFRPARQQAATIKRKHAKR